MTILFDLDGTLIDSTEAILESFYKTFEIFDLPFPKEADIKALVGHPLDVMYKELGVEEKIVWDLVDAYKEHYREISTQKTVLLPFAREAVELASKNARVGVVTTKTGKYSKLLMEHFNVMKHFEILIGREDVKNPKPHAEPIQKAIDFLRVDKEDCWMIGDTRMDLISAKNAGIKSVAVISEYEAVEELKKHTNIIKSNALEAVRSILK
ncbi:HAD family hydrolase [Sulfurimonas sp. HSL-1716]|uniref:HAD family hydrolase n=1 Tax=Hydrocurvibacter sulfurireducens TaxID=3131937 RepID=UPI0031F83F87